MSWLMTGVIKRHFHAPPALKLLALVLGDYADDDGGSIYPSVAKLAHECGTSERTIQRNLRQLESMGLLERVSAGAGGTRLVNGARVGLTASYRVSHAWLKSCGANLSPYAQTQAEKGDKAASPHPHRTVTSGVACGDIAVSPEPTRRVNTNTPPNPPPGGESGDAKPVEGKRPREAKPQLTLTAWLALCKAKGEDAIPETDAVFAYCDTVGIARELLRLHWGEFKRRRTRQGKRQADWRQTFRNSVEDNWYRLWFIRPGQPAELTTQGHQAKALQEAEALRRVQEREAAEAQPA